MARLVRYIVDAKGSVDPRSWEQTAGYILDTHRAANTHGEKVGGVRVTNCGTDDPAAAAILIDAVQHINTTSNSDKTYHLMFAFPPGEEPPLDVMHHIENELCEAIGYGDHQRISAVHVDTDHLHVHVAINKVHPEGYQNIEPYFDKKKLMQTCARLERELGLIKTHHNTQEKENERSVKRAITLGAESQPEQRDTKFRAYLRKCYAFEVADRPEAKTLNGMRNLSRCRLDGLAERTEVLLSGHARTGLQQRRTDQFERLRRAGNGLGADERGLSAKVIEIERQSGMETLAGYVAREVGDNIRVAQDWQGLHKALADHGLIIAKRGAGFIIGDPELGIWCKASQADRGFSLKSLSNRLGPFEKKKGAPVFPSKRYEKRPVHPHPSTAALYATYQEQRARRSDQRWSSMAELKQTTQRERDKIQVWRKAQLALNKTAAKGPTRRAMAMTINGQAKAAHHRLSADAKRRRSEIHKKGQSMSWADWLVVQAEHGNSEAIDVLRSREERQRRLHGDLLTASRAETAKAVVLKNLRPTVRKNGDLSYRTADGGVVIDRQTAVHAQTNTAGAAFVALTVASQRFEGQPLVVEGTANFQADVARLAGLHKVSVNFADGAMEEIRQRAVRELVLSDQQVDVLEDVIEPRGGLVSGKPPVARSKPQDAPNSVRQWVENRNAMRDKIYSTEYKYRIWTPDDAGSAEYHGRRKMKDGVEVLLLQRNEEILVKPSTSRVVAKASKWKVGKPVEIDSRGRFVETRKGLEL